MKFLEAVLYAKNAITDEATKDAYQASAEEGETAYNVAVADFLNAPLINEIDVSHYTGQPNCNIQVRAVDDLEVKEVTITIQNSDGTEVESGAAVHTAVRWTKSPWRWFPMRALRQSFSYMASGQVPGNGFYSVITCRMA